MREGESVCVYVCMLYVCMCVCVVCVLCVVIERERGVEEKIAR